MQKHYAMPAWDEGYEYIGLWEETSAPSSAVECTAPAQPDKLGYMRFSTSLNDWYWPASAVLRFERVWRDQQWHEADVGLMLAQDENVKSVGTVQDWQDYKNALRDWPDHPSLSPESSLRPQKPTV